MTSAKFNLLQYDIPERKGADKIPNPSARLRRFAIRSSKSVWIVPAELTPWPLLNRWTEQGVTWHLVPFASDQEGLKLVLAMATHALRSEIESIQASARKSVAKAEASLEEEVTDKALSTVEKKCRAAIRRNQRLLQDAEAAAKTFGIHADTIGLVNAHDSLQGMEAMNKLRASLYADMAEKVKDPGMRLAAAEGDVPAAILADFIAEESEEDMDHVAAAFMDPPAA